MDLMQIASELALHLAPLAEMISNHGLADSSRYASYIYARPPALVSTTLATFSFSCAQASVCSGNHKALATTRLLPHIAVTNLLATMH